MGDKYGEVMLPLEISKNEFDKILAIALETSKGNFFLSLKRVRLPKGQNLQKKIFFKKLNNIFS